MREIEGGRQFRIRGAHLNAGVLTLVDPSGAFVVFPGGSKLNLATSTVALQEHYALSPQLDEAFAVRVAGVHRRLVHTSIPGLLGFLRVGDYEIVLRHLRTHLGALVVVQDDGRFTTIAEAEVQRLHETEVGASDPPRVGESAGRRPTSWSVADVSRAIHEIPTLHRAVRRHLAWLFAATASMPSARTLRQVAWALVLAHADGFRTTEPTPSLEITQQLEDWGYLDQAPSKRARQGAMRLLEELSPFVARPSEGARRWLVRYSDLSQPSPETRARMERLQRAGCPP